MKKNLMGLLGLGLLSLSLVACGGGAKNKETEAPKQDAKTEKTEAAQDKTEAAAENAEDLGDSLTLYCSMTDDDVDTSGYYGRGCKRICRRAFRKIKGGVCQSAG